MRGVAFLISALVAANVAHGAEQSRIPKKMRAELQRLVGTWRVEGRIGDEKITATWSARWAPGRHCLMRHSTRTDGGEKTIGIGVIGWDPATETITEQVFFSNMDSALLRWKVLSPGKWEGVVTGFQDGEKTDSKAKFTRMGPNEIVYEAKTADGEEIEGVLRKIPVKTGSPPTTSVPEAALNEMKYRVGRWTSVAYIDGEKQDEPGFEATEWVAGRYAIRVRATWVEDGVRLNASSIIGWDTDKKQLVEHWYASDGGYATFRYNLDKKDVWHGTFTWVYGDGRKLEGKSVVQKTGDDEWEWNASSTTDGKKHTFRTINRRVK